MNIAEQKKMNYATAKAYISTLTKEEKFLLYQMLKTKSQKGAG